MLEVKSLTLGAYQTNCYIIRDNASSRCCLIDPGYDADTVLDKLTELGLTVEAILLTHGHFDHMMAAKELKEAWHVPIYACEKEIEVLSDSRKSLVSSYYREPYTLTPDITVKEGDELSIAGFTWKVFETPGHTIGSCCYYIEKESVLFSGDTLFAGSYGRTDFPTGSGRQIAESVRRLLSTLPDDTMVYPGHMDTTTIGFEKKYNPLSGAMR